VFGDCYLPENYYLIKDNGTSFVGVRPTAGRLTDRLPGELSSGCYARVAYDKSGEVMRLR
jgi:hypothetical protein